MDIPIYQRLLGRLNSNDKGSWIDIYPEDLKDLTSSYIIDKPGRYRLKGLENQIL